ncbi:hypothetical protein PAXRUDRAFT_22275 [Paxillus rubicundulus Ve08.2h10]|uniref:Uncharacterized protein n=1 Tax=Paxillus rubicundulus Ve08.2h10 TaxID=930991 RepID=A0A0D0BKK8_9AGAM|nr:hypothetical protein PAXRUDRAFT_22275 [Paxillus rubicundulus Ve08.2h10]
MPYPDEVPSSPMYVPSELGTDHGEGEDSDYSPSESGDSDDSDTESESTGPFLPLDHTTTVQYDEIPPPAPWQQPVTEMPSSPSTTTSTNTTVQTSTTIMRSTSVFSEWGAPANLRNPPLLSYAQVMSCEREELWAHIQQLYSQNKALVGILQISRNKSAESRKKIQARFVTLPELRAAFEAEEVELLEKEKVEAVKAPKKKVDDAARTRRIYQEVDNRIFDAPLSTYKRKDDLVALAVLFSSSRKRLAAVLSLPMEGTVAELTKAIKDHLAANPSRTNDPRFSALFSNLYFALGHAPLPDRDLAIAARGLEVESPLTGPTLHATPGDRGRGGAACKNSCVVVDDVFLTQGRPLESA